jgi:hypothetical protein
MAKDLTQDSQFDGVWLRGIVHWKGFQLSSHELEWLIAGLNIMTALLREPRMSLEMFLHRVKFWEGSVIPKPADVLVREIANKISESDNHPLVAADCLKKVALELALDEAAFFAQRFPDKEPTKTL